MDEMILNENNVVEIMVSFLEEKGYTIESSCQTDEKGVDIVAKKETETLFVEAKGGTSSKETSSRFGKPFDKNQVKSHVSRAVFTAMEVYNVNESNSKSAIALPDDENHRAEVSKVEKALNTLGIDVYLVSKDKVSLLSN